MTGRSLNSCPSSHFLSSYPMMKLQHAKLHASRLGPGIGEHKQPKQCDRKIPEIMHLSEARNTHRQLASLGLFLLGRSFEARYIDTRDSGRQRDRPVKRQSIPASTTAQTSAPPATKGILNH